MPVTNQLSTYEGDWTACQGTSYNTLINLIYISPDFLHRPHPNYSRS